MRLSLALDPTVPHQQHAPDSDAVWPLWRRMLFRFTAVYVFAYVGAYLMNFTSELPGLGLIGNVYASAEDALVTWLNAHLFHVKDQLVPMAGSGDTSYGYAQLCFFTLVAFVGTVIWSALMRRRSHERLTYWVVVTLRYFVAATALAYGIIKLFGMQMPFPSTSELATPIGDLLPMRLSWFFMGYSKPYEFFSGLMEVIAGVLLLWRRTATLGALAATGVFLNVMMMNLSYDIPVKIFSTHLFLFSVCLLLADARRLLDFFVFNRPTSPRWEPRFLDRRARIGRYAIKTLFLLFFGALPLGFSFAQYQAMNAPLTQPHLTPGVYEVTAMQPAPPDSLRWHDFIVEATTTIGSIRTDDRRLGQRYRRGYFNYALDSATHTLLTMRRGRRDTVTIGRFRVAQPDTGRLILRGRYRGDSLTVALRRVPRHFQLAERQFHWLSEDNR